MNSIEYRATGACGTLPLHMPKEAHDADNQIDTCQSLLEKVAQIEGKCFGHSLKSVWYGLIDLFACIWDRAKTKQTVICAELSKVLSSQPKPSSAPSLASRAQRLPSHIAAYLDRLPRPLKHLEPVTFEETHAKYAGHLSTLRDAFLESYGSLYRNLYERSRNLVASANFASLEDNDPRKDKIRDLQYQIIELPHLHKRSLSEDPRTFDTKILMISSELKQIERSMDFTGDQVDPLWEHRFHLPNRVDLLRKSCDDFLAKVLNYKHSLGYGYDDQSPEIGPTLEKAMKTGPLAADKQQFNRDYSELAYLEYYLSKQL